MPATAEYRPIKDSTAGNFYVYEPWSSYAGGTAILQISEPASANEPFLSEDTPLNIIDWNVVALRVGSCSAAQVESLTRCVDPLSFGLDDEFVDFALELYQRQPEFDSTSESVCAADWTEPRAVAHESIEATMSLSDAVVAAMKALAADKARWERTAEAEARYIENIWGGEWEESDSDDLRSS